MQGDDFFIPTETISLGKANLTVRGLSYADITKILNKFGIQSVEQLLSKLENFEKLDFGRIINDFPDQVAFIIALAADMSDRVSDIARMPAPAQTRAIIAIYNLTVVEPGGIESFFESVLAMLSGIRKSLPDLSNSLSKIKSESKNTG